MTVSICNFFTSHVLDILKIRMMKAKMAQRIKEVFNVMIVKAEDIIFLLGKTGVNGLYLNKITYLCVKLQNRMLHNPCCSYTSA